MKHYFLHDVMGRIHEAGVCPSDDFFLQMRSGCLLKEGTANPFNDYFDGETVVTMPECPSPNHVFDYGLKVWVDPRTLIDFKEAKWQEIKQARSAFEFGGLTWNGFVFDSDTVSQSRIMGAVQLATLSSDFSMEWTLADNSICLLNRSDFINLGIALGTHVSIAHEKARQLRETIEAANSLEEIIHITF